MNMAPEGPGAWMAETIRREFLDHGVPGVLRMMNVLGGFAEDDPDVTETHRDAFAMMELRGRDFDVPGLDYVRAAAARWMAQEDRAGRWQKGDGLDDALMQLAGWGILRRCRELREGRG